MSSTTESEGQQYADHLQQILNANDPEDFWTGIEDNAQKLGDVLRSRSGPGWWELWMFGLSLNILA